MVHVTQSGLVTVAQAAKMLGWSRWTVVRHIKAGTLHAQKLTDAPTSPWILHRSDVELHALGLNLEDGAA